MRCQFSLANKTKLSETVIIHLPFLNFINYFEGHCPQYLGMVSKSTEELTLPASDPIPATDRGLSSILVWYGVRCVHRANHTNKAWKMCLVHRTNYTNKCENPCLLYLVPVPRFYVRTPSEVPCLFYLKSSYIES